MKAAEVKQALLTILEPFVQNAHVPYSGKERAAALLLPDGTVVPGVRVESASFSLTIPAALNAISTGVAAGHSRFSALTLSGPVSLTTAGLLEGFGLFEGDTPGLWTSQMSLPTPSKVLDPFLPASAVDMEAAVLLARDISSLAWIPESNFPVGAALFTRDGRTIPGVNVEHADWTCILCAERSALGTAVTYKALPAISLALSCPADPGASPCGACRQLIAELAPKATIWMDRANSLPSESSPEALLPLAFSGKSLGC